MECLDLDSDMFLYEERTTTTEATRVTTAKPMTTEKILADAHRNYIIGASVGVLVFLTIVIALHLVKKNTQCEVLEKKDSQSS